MEIHTLADRVDDLSNSKKLALVKLLADEDPAVYQLVQKKIVSFGADAGEWLRPYRLSNDPLLRRRIKLILDEFSQNQADQEFLKFCSTRSDDMDLETGVFLLCRTQYPDISIEGYQALLDGFAGDLSRFSHGSHNAENILGGINHYLFTHLGFSGDEDNYYDPDNNFLNRVIDRRRGNPMSLSIIYLLVAQRLKLPVVGIGMPSHFLCRFQTSIKEVYIDAFNRGKILTRADCINFLQQAGYGFKEEFLAPANSRQILFRVCSNLQYAYNQGQKSTEHARIQSYLSVLSKK